MTVNNENSSPLLENGLLKSIKSHCGGHLAQHRSGSLMTRRSTEGKATSKRPYNLGSLHGNLICLYGFAQLYPLHSPH